MLIALSHENSKTKLFVRQPILRMCDNISRFRCENCQTYDLTRLDKRSLELMQILCGPPVVCPFVDLMMFLSSCVRNLYIIKKAVI